MYNNAQHLTNMRKLDVPQEVTLGDGHTLQGLAEGTVKLETILPDCTTRKCKLEKVLYVPKLSYNIISISKVSEAGKATSELK